MTTETIVRLSWRMFFFVARVIIGTWLALIVMVAGHIAWVQSRPATDFVDLKAVIVDTSVNPVMVHIERTVNEDSDVIVAAEITSTQDHSYQPCVTGFRSIADKEGSPEVSVPLDNILANCNLQRLARLGHEYTLKVVYTVELDYGIRKRIVGESAPFRLKDYGL